jgi:hypothetical protein
MKKWRKTLLISFIEIAALLVAHRLLLVTLAEGSLISHIFAGGQNASRGELTVVIAFIAVRLLAVLALPGMILSRIGLVWMDMRTNKGEGHE